MFSATRNSGFQLTFSNGYTISVQFGYGTYSENHHHPDGFDFAKTRDLVTSEDAEIAIWDANYNWFTFDNDDQVMGHCSVDEVLSWINRVSQWKNISQK